MFCSRRIFYFASSSKFLPNFFLFILFTANNANGLYVHIQYCVWRHRKKSFTCCWSCLSRNLREFCQNSIIIGSANQSVYSHATVQANENTLRWRFLTNSIKLISTKKNCTYYLIKNMHIDLWSVNMHNNIRIWNQLALLALWTSNQNKHFLLTEKPYFMALITVKINTKANRL